MNTDDRNGVLGGRGNAWCYGALVKGRVEIGRAHV